MNSTLDRILMGLMVVLIAVLGWRVSGSLEEPVIRVGDKAPEFSVVTDSGKTVKLPDFGGKVLVLNFWAAWCSPCADEIPSLTAFHREYGPQGVVVLGVSVDTNKELYNRFIDQFGINFETSRDPEWNIPASYGTFQLPETYIIDSSGKVVEKVIGIRNWMDPGWLAGIKKLL